MIQCLSSNEARKINYVGILKQATNLSKLMSPGAFTVEKCFTKWLLSVALSLAEILTHDTTRSSQDDSGPSAIRAQNRAD